MAHTQYPSMHRSKGHDNIDEEVDDYRSRRRAVKLNAEGAWVASLFLIAVALLMPLWFLATSVAFVNAELEAVGSAPMFARSTEIILLGLGTVATWFARAPRLGKGPRRQRLRIGSIGALAWAFASASLLLVVTIPEAWWLPTFFALCGSVCTAPAALRVWRHYEGAVASAAH